MLESLVHNKPILSHFIIASGLGANILSLLSIINPVLGCCCGVLSLIFAYYKVLDQMHKTKLSKNEVEKLKLRQKHNHKG